jgi:alanine racemase
VVRPTFAKIDLEVLKANYLAVHEFVGRLPDGSYDQTPPDIIAVIKANAYGHGSVAVARALEDAGAKMLACADIEEGVLLRQAGIRAQILVFGALSISDLNGIFDHRLIPTVSSPSAARALQVAASNRALQLHCHLKIDTGMNRFGFRYDNLASTLPEVIASPNLIFDQVYTHFATADQPSNQLFKEQLRRFDAVLVALSSLGVDALRRHTANSAAILHSRQSWFEAVRPGLLLYGVAPRSFAIPQALKIHPVMSLQSRVVAVKGMRSGETAGYGARFSTDRPARIAIVPAGYADGLDTRLSGCGSVLIRGCRVSIIGSVCMDSISVDVTELDVVSPGDEVVILGSQGNDQISVSEMAEWIGAVPHEILCRTGSRIERIYTSI